MANRFGLLLALAVVVLAAGCGGEAGRASEAQKKVSFSPMYAIPPVFGANCTLGGEVTNDTTFTVDVRARFRVVGDGRQIATVPVQVRSLPSGRTVEIEKPFRCDSPPEKMLVERVGLSAERP
jgi:hypothetical protein